MTHPLIGGVVLVTGASSGIGRELAIHVAPHAKAIALVARRKDRLDQLAAELEKSKPGLKAFAVECDLADLSACDRMLAEVMKELGPIDVLVNNAGFGDLGVFDKADWKKTKQMIDLNVTALVYLTHKVLPGMVERNRGGILNISSGFGLTFAPGGSTYVGTKHFVTGFTECLRLDMAGLDVVVTQVCPGPVKTEFSDNIGNFTGQEPPGFVTVTAKHVARGSVRAFLRKRAMYVPGFWISLLVPLGMHTPRWFLRFLYSFGGKILRRKQMSA
jgi:hypothetical protein